MAFPIVFYILTVKYVSKRFPATKKRKKELIGICIYTHVVSQGQGGHRKDVGLYHLD
jgi:hypothetical protein